ncbi:MAG TPA: helical backbone metal receptor [Bacteroidia bacterium]|nr:helical backbone metal receptor [Bacteroidia bacterium]
MAAFIDQMNRTIELEKIPQRIISLVPSQTELLSDLGLEKEVVGITRFCIHPESWFRNKTRIGGTKQFNFEKIKSLQPDLIIGNKEENEKEQIEELMQDYTVWMSDIKSLSDACEMIRKVGELTGKKEKAENFASEIKSRFDAFQKQVESFPVKRVAYFIWKNPWMAAGKDTFIDHILKKCHWENVFSDYPGRYPEITSNDLKKSDPGIILLSSEPYPFKEKHIEELKSICPQASILLVDGELFSWYGTRLLKSPDYLLSLLSSIG